MSIKNIYLKIEKSMYLILYGIRRALDLVSALNLNPTLPLMGQWLLSNQTIALSLGAVCKMVIVRASFQKDLS